MDKPWTVSEPELVIVMVREVLVIPVAGLGICNARLDTLLESAIGSIMTFSVDEGEGL